MKLYSLDEIRRFENFILSLPSSNVRNSFPLLYHSGMSVPELIALNISDYDPSEQSLQISWRLVYDYPDAYSSKKELFRSPLPASRCRRIFLSPSAAFWMGRMTLADDPERCILLSKNRNCLYPFHYVGSFRNMVQKAGLPYYGLSAFRLSVCAAADGSAAAQRGTAV